MHIVHSVTSESAPGCPPAGCAAVAAVLFEVAGDGEATASTAELEKVFGRIPSVVHEGVSRAPAPHTTLARGGRGARPALPCAWPELITNSVRLSAHAPPPTQSEVALTAASLDLNKLLPTDHTYVTYA